MKARSDMEAVPIVSICATPTAWIFPAMVMWSRSAQEDASGTVLAAYDEGNGRRHGWFVYRAKSRWRAHPDGAPHASRDFGTMAAARRYAEQVAAAERTGASWPSRPSGSPSARRARGAER